MTCMVLVIVTTKCVNGDTGGGSLEGNCGDCHILLGVTRIYAI